MICLFTYPICDNDRLNIRSICRHSCHYFQNNACSNLFSYQKTYSNRKLTKENRRKKKPKFLFFVIVQILQNIPTCDNLPPTSDDSSCINLDQTISILRNGNFFFTF
jgi:hypothetical protein